MNQAPLVSVIVRSMGRPELAMALESLARQDHPRIEVIVVDATGGSHPPLPALRWREGHAVRMVGGGRRLPRPRAANVGLLAASGDWFCFLDDDDTYDPGFVSSMVQAAAAHPDALLIYGSARMLNAEGKVEYEFGAPFNRALMHYGPLFYWQAALIRREAVDLGCRFDEELDVCEDRDFLARIAEHGEFVHVPVVGFNYRPDLGTSGTAGMNRDLARTTRFDALLRAKWAGAGAYHTWLATRLCTRAIWAYQDGDRAASERLFEAAMRDYPGDPNALHGLARLRLDDGRLDLAADLVQRALAISPRSAEYHLTRSMILERLGRLDEARRAALQAATDPAVRPSAEAVLSRLDLPDASLDPSPPARGTVAVNSRLSPCPCGSGKRFKQCCGRPRAEPVRSDAEQRVLRARGFHARGEADRAKGLIDGLTPADIGDADLALSAAEICLGLASYEQAYGFLDRSLRLKPSLRAGGMLTDCCDLIWQSRARASAHAMANRLRERIERRAAPRPSASLAAPPGRPFGPTRPPSTRKGQAVSVIPLKRQRLRSGPSRSWGGPAHDLRGPIHLLGMFGHMGDSARQAAELYRVLSPHADVRLWSTRPLLAREAPGLPVNMTRPGIGLFPNGGTLILAGHHFDHGDWWKRAEFDRVVIWVSQDRPMELVHRLAQLEEAVRVGRIEFAFASRRYRDLSALPGEVDYPLVEPSPQPASRKSTGATLLIGRRVGESGRHRHPNDPAFFRQLALRGHRLRLRGDAGTQAAFADEPSASCIDWLPVDVDEGDFLGGLDCLVFRHRPGVFEACGREVLEAMAMALPVVVFRQDVGVAELIEHGRDGFLVDSEAEALACIDRLAAEPGLRRAMGEAARDKVATVMKLQRERLLARYAGSTPVQDCILEESE